MSILFVLLSSLVAGAQPAAETSPEVDAAALTSAEDKGFWKKGWGGFGGFTTIGNGGTGVSTDIGPVGTTIFFTSFFTETLPGPPVTVSLTLPGFTTTIFATGTPAVVPPPPATTSFTTVASTLTVIQS